MPPVIGVIGAGYVGLVTAACFASLGHAVVVRDIDRARIDLLTRGAVPIYEPGLSQMIELHRSRLTFTLAMEDLLRHAEIVFIAVDTPTTPSGDADLSSVRSALSELAAIEGVGARTIVMKSILPVGTGQKIRPSSGRLFC